MINIYQHVYLLLDHFLTKCYSMTSSNGLAEAAIFVNTLHWVQDEAHDLLNLASARLATFAIYLVEVALAFGTPSDLARVFFAIVQVWSYHSLNKILINSARSACSLHIK